MDLLFYRELDNRWYVDLPDYPGSKADLEMVCGADQMLNIMSEDKDKVKLVLETIPFDNSDTLELISLADDIGEGAYYTLPHYNGIEFNLDMWLCDVTKFVFGDFPKTIYISVID